MLMRSRAMRMLRLFWAVVLACLLLGAGMWLDSVEASGGVDGGSAVCSTCHATPGLEIRDSNGETRSATVDPDRFKNSVHGGMLQCTACHQEVTAWPHLSPGTFFESPRDVGKLLRSTATCGECHPDAYRSYLSSHHASALAGGDAESASCSDCHGAHEIQPANAVRTGLALTPAVESCADCHEDEYAEYRDSIHGRALLSKEDVNVPACVDCHGFHSMGSATGAEFRSQSPALCATCHADEQMMAKYQLSSDVFNTYAEDFHGASAQLIGTASGAAPEQATCYDCHGTHNIRSVTDPESRVVSQNILATCQECHADAGERFPVAWLGHSEPSPSSSAPVYWTNRFFTILTVGVMVGLIGHILLDVLRSLLDRLGKA